MDKVKKIGIISVILILSLSVGLLSYNQSITEESVRDRFIEEEKERQLESTKSISNHIQSDLNLVITMLDGLATSKYFQEGDLMGTEPETLLKEKYFGYSDIVNRLFVIDKDGVVRMSLAPRGTETFLGQDFSLRNWVKDTKTNLSLTLSGGFERQGIYREFITYPIVNRESNEYIGMVGAAIPTEPFFAKYGNVELGDRQFLVAFDRSGTILANGADKKLMGQNYFGDYVQDFINRNTILNNLTHALLMGNSGYAIYDYGRGERLTTQSPIIIGDRPEFFLQIVTPTDQIHSQIRHVISDENIKMITLFTSTFAAVVVLIILLAKWNNTLIKEVEKKTRELFEAEKRRKEIEESLESMKEYVNDVLLVAKTAMHIRRLRGFGGRKNVF